jgi:hypothetical protein
MLITSATTVNTVSYLSLYELEQYKKQFQSFWLPFMEQFIPATTIWVAGERWCNEPCPILNVCDYDFELVEAEISIQEVPNGLFNTGRTSYTTFVLTGRTSITGSLGTPTGSNPKTSQLITPVKDLGSTTSTLLLRTTAEASIDITSYRSRFTSLTTETTII